MANPELNVPFVPGSLEEIRDAILADIRLEAAKVGLEPAVQPGTDMWWFATAHASASMLQYSSIELARDAITPLNATGQDLENWRLALGLPEVEPSPATGKIALTVAGTATVSDGEQLTLPNGLRAKVVGTWIGVVDGAEVDVVTIDTGSAANFDADTELRFINPPTNVNEIALVSRSSPLRGGTDEESDDRKRSRVLNALANKPGGGNWGQVREVVLNELGSVSDCYVMPALGGPASVKVVPVRDFDADNNEFTRELSSAAVTIVRDAIYREMPDEIEFVVEAANDQDVDVALKVTIPDSSLSGGNGQGWTDSAPWPLLAGDTRVTVTTVTSTTVVTVNALTATAPIAGQTHIAWWSRVDRKFRTFLVTAQSGGTGAWVLTLDRPLVADDGSQVQVGDFISPAAVNMESYGDSWLKTLSALGPGENTTDAARIPRALRHPYVADEDPINLSFLSLESFRKDHSEITDIEWSYRSISAPTVPGTVDSPPNVLVPLHFGIYKL